MRENAAYLRECRLAVRQRRVFNGVAFTQTDGSG